MYQIYPGYYTGVAACFRLHPFNEGAKLAPGHPASPPLPPVFWWNLETIKGAWHTLLYGRHTASMVRRFWSPISRSPYIQTHKQPTSIKQGCKWRTISHDVTKFRYTRFVKGYGSSNMYCIPISCIDHFIHQDQISSTRPRNWDFRHKYSFLQIPSIVNLDNCTVHLRWDSKVHRKRI